MNGQSTTHVLLIRPVEFYSNQQTIETNHYQSVDDDKPHSEILEDALIEFDNFENNLLENNIKVTTLTGQEGCPDNIFPNWAVTYDDQSMHLFSMLGENRRLEKSDEHITFLNKQYRTTLDYSPYENQSRFLIVFETQSHSGNPIYHSDVLMYIGTELAVVCSEAIKVGANNVINELSHTHRILEISSQQLLDFCGNCIEIKDTNNNLNLIMSTSAFEGYDSSQLNVLNEHFTKIIYSDLKTIEKYGGGSARCMIMELY